MQRRARLFFYAFPLGASIFMLVVFALGSGVADALIYHRPSVLAGEWWRLLSGHWVHRGGRHLVLNLVGLALIWHLFGAVLKFRNALFLIVFVALGQSISLMVIYPDILWFEGLSGLLHGLLVAGAVLSFSRTPVVSGMVLAMLVVKLSSEAWHGGSTEMTAWLGGSVLEESHWCGAIAGLIGSVCISAYSRKSLAIS